MKLDPILARTRRVIDQVPLSQEHNLIDSHVLGSPSTSFSDENLIDRINNAQRVIASRVKACHVPSLVSSYNEALADINDDIIRILPGRVIRDGVRCVRRSVDTHRRLINAGRAASAAFPVYTYEDGELAVYPTPDDNLDGTYGYTAAVVLVPPRLTAADLGQVPETDLALDERFELALVMYVAATCYQTMQQPPLMDFAMAVFEEEIEPFTQGVRYGVMDDREVAVE